jgi:programmed cell death protein 4
MLLHSAEDMALGIPCAANDLALFVACVVVDDIVAPLYLEEINEQLAKGCLGREIVHIFTINAVACKWMCIALLGLEWHWSSSERLSFSLRKAGGELAETCQCICDLDMPFFHHEVVKKALVTAMEKKNYHVLSLLRKCSQEVLINTRQMGKEFSCVLAWMTALNIPDAKEKVTLHMAQAKQEGWLNLNFDQTQLTIPMAQRWKCESTVLMSIWFHDALTHLLYQLLCITQSLYISCNCSCGHF